MLQHALLSAAGETRGPRGQRARARLLERACRLAAVGLVAIAAPARADTTPARDAVPGQETLRRAFDNRYDLDVTQRIQLILSNDQGASRRRVVEMASKRIAGQLHSLGRFTHPPYMRGTTLLVIENRDRSDDQFVLLPSNDRVRRIGQGRKGDAFMGTDFSYEDLERQYPEDFEIIGTSQGELESESVVTIRARPRHASAYRLMEFSVSPADFAILRVRYFRDDFDEPVKILDAPRADMQRVDGHVLPTLMTMRDLRRGTRTDARFENIVVNPEIDDSLFTAVAMESGRQIPVDASLPNGSGPDAGSAAR